MFVLYNDVFLYEIKITIMKDYICKDDLKIIITSFEGLENGGEVLLNVYGPTILEAKRILGKSFGFRPVSYDQFWIKKSKSSNTKQSEIERAISKFDGNDIEINVSYNTARALMNTYNAVNGTDLTVKSVEGKTVLTVKKQSVRKMVYNMIASNGDKLEIDRSHAVTLEYLRVICSGTGYSPFKTETGFLIIRKDLLAQHKRMQKIEKLKSKIQELEQTLADDEIIE